MKIFHPIQTQRGFTLIEMIVSVFIFSIVMVIATGSLVSIINANRKAQSVKSVMNNLNFALDSMTRAIRVGKDYDCTISSCATVGSSVFQFTNVNGSTVVYQINKETAGIERSIDGGDPAPLTAPEVTVTELTFYADGTSPSDNEQPRVLIVLRGHAGEGRSQTDFQLETLVSQRILDR